MFDSVRNLKSDIKLELMRILYSQYFFCALARQFSFFMYHKKYFVSLEKELHSDVLHLLRGSAIYPRYYNGYFVDNSAYGIERVIMRYAGVDNPYLHYIEHGLFLGRHLNYGERDVFSKKVITLSERRAGYIREACQGFDVAPIGPYILYAQSLLSADYIQTLKSSLGGVFLFFPLHSSSSVMYQFSSEYFRSLAVIAKDYEKRIVCLHWRDFADSAIRRLYEQEGFDVLTAGHIYSPLFLPRLKAIIELSDVTFSSGVGTHIGYCVVLGKKHYIVNMNGLNRTIPDQSPACRIYGEYHDSRVAEENIIQSVFLADNNCGDDEKSEIVNDFWGASLVKTQCEMRSILQSS